MSRMNTFIKILSIFFILLVPAKADTDKFSNKLSFYSGTFDFSDEGAKSTLYGIQYINLNTSYGSTKKKNNSFKEK